MKIGSHNTMTYLKPSQWWLRPFAWMGKCQSKDIRDQFICYGIRWFDLRLTFDKKNSTPYFAHGLFSYKEIDPFTILNFLEAVSKAVQEKVYIRLINERNSDFNKKCFTLFCKKVEEKYPNLIFIGGQNKKDWKIIYSFKNEPDIPVIDKYSSCNHDTCEYDKQGKEIKHIDNISTIIDDIYPEWYAKKNNLKNRNKYQDQNVYLIQDFIGKY